ncbi:MAG: lipoprotein signal peptidase [Gammaproteobacteria bacterium]|nr:lipoprotein signal peptidase [Gammaproteobacteria bacterium]
MPEHAKYSALRWLWLAVLIVVLDQVTKIWAETVLSAGGPIEVLSWFNFSLAYNRGAAFSFLAAAGGWQRYFFLGIGLIAVVIIVAWLRRLQAHEQMTALGLVSILGGAVGNLIDRALYGHVIDFIDWHYAGWHWPAFNIADSAILIGAVLVVLSGLRSRKQEQAA